METREREREEKSSRVGKETGVEKRQGRDNTQGDTDTPLRCDPIEMTQLYSLLCSSSRRASLARNSHIPASLSPQFLTDKFETP